MNLLLFTILSTLAIAYGDVNCKEVPECLYNPKIGESLPVTEEEILSECTDYRLYQNCIQGWIKECLSPEAAAAYVEKSDKSIKFIKALCGNQIFRQEYLSEKDNFAKIADKWKNCIHVFQKVKMESAMMNNTVEGMDICCGLHSYSDCNEKICDSDCTGPVKEILGRIIEMTKSGYDLVDCKAVDMSKCPPTSGSTRSLYSFVFTVIPIVVLLVFYH